MSLILLLLPATDDTKVFTINSTSQGTEQETVVMRINKKSINNNLFNVFIKVPYYKFIGRKQCADNELNNIVFTKKQIFNFDLKSCFFDHMGETGEQIDTL